MANKIYTAQEMRETADFFYRNAEMVRRKVLSNAILANIHEVIPMLHQAANAMERKKKREKKREKKYEYSVHPADVYGVFQHRSAAELNVNFFKAIGVRAHLVRREVGEWEEVKDGD